MLRVYVTELPTEPTECPFYNGNNKKCNIDNSKCCLSSSPDCKHLLTLNFGFYEEDEKDALQ